MSKSREDYREGYNDAISDILDILRDCENESERKRAMTTIYNLRLHR